MIEILILYSLSKGQNTMYGIAKGIERLFGSLTNPSLGTIQPALKRLEKNKFLTINKFFTDGGKPYYYYSITTEGKEELNNLLLSNNVSNPIQLYPLTRVKLICADVLNNDNKKVMYKYLKGNLIKLAAIGENTLKDEVYKDSSDGRMVINNIVCEAKNLIELIERLEKCPQ